MNNLKNIFNFGWPYLRRYKGRLITGILLGFLFGASNASFVWATRTLFTRLSPPAAVTQTEKSKDQKEATGWFADLKKYLAAEGKKIQQHLEADVDPWLPRIQRSLDWRQILGGLLLLPVLVCFRGSVGYLNSYCMAWVSERVVKDLRLDLLNKLNSLSMDFFNKSTVGELMGRVNGDTQALYRCLSLGFSDLVKEPITVVCVAIGLFVMDWELTLLSLMFVPTIVIPIRILSKKAKKAFKSGIQEGIGQDSLVVEVYSSIRVVKAFCLEPLQMQRFKRIYENLVRIGMKSVQAKELINPIIETVSVLGLGVVIVFICKTNRSLPDMAAFLTGVILMYTPIKKLGGIPVYFQQANVGAERLIQLFALQPTVKEKPNAVVLKSFEKAITFENVSFAYEGKPPALKNFSLTVPRGMKLGIAGQSGSGKSTLVSLTLRFYDPISGCIKIDGHDLRDLSVSDMRTQMAFVSQDIVLFDQTIADNIANGKPGATREEIVTAAKAAYAHDFIMALPKGYETRPGEMGKNLSGGQKQRLCIARAFIRNAPILILDEATSSLDPEAEAEVQAAIDRLAEHRTVICIAHRLSTLTNTDKIIVMNNGHIVEQGHFDELMEAGGTFANLARMQGITAKKNMVAQRLA
jgi:ATP-binding cassette, subfamily B, bacterial MsbA